MPVDDAFPEPLVYEPASGIHKHTVILLHGRGGSADAFGPTLLSTALLTADSGTSTRETCPRLQRRDGPASDGSSQRLPDPDRPTTLAGALPHSRFVFPAAPRQRATVYRRSVIRQWFDDWHLGFAADEVDGRYDVGLQTTGLGRTVAYLHGLVAEEAALVGGARNVILGGISQGCASSLVASILWEGEEGLGGVVGMCGWLPYTSQMRGQLVVEDGVETEDSVAAKASDNEGGFDPFERPSSPDSDVGLEGKTAAGCSVDAALEWLRDEIEAPERQLASSDMPRSITPAILCHGRDDEKVEVANGSEAAEFLPALGMAPVRFKEYAGVAHEFSAEMLFDIAVFIQDVLGSPPS